MPTGRVRRYPSDTTDAEWRVMARYVPAGGAGRAVSYPRRDVVDAIRYLAHNGCVWRALPVDFPPWPTVYHYFRTWTRDGTLTRLHAGLREQVRTAEGRNAQPSAALIDSQSVRTAETVARAQRSFDAGKKVNGRKRHIAVDTTGLLLVVLVTAAGVQDRDGGRVLLWALRTCFQRVTMIWADAGYQGHLVDWAAKCLGITVAIVRKLAGQVGFQVLHRRWVVERTLSWITRCRCTVRDYERQPEHHAAMVQWAMVIIMTRRLARRSQARRPKPRPLSADLAI
ncbi:IS5 family transposase [Catellatospora sp. KI3]|uniref:IS5 family transposase n=1 Tax=Catellatospora sp. KI3 TaxID=3041620 RepID=UPI0024832571|nr:IS5 family transposase [Catellatospora sp. KI3]MDI1463378.1 IS5 family transposase [Catellatospora sp. KI3]